MNLVLSIGSIFGAATVIAASLFCRPSQVDFKQRLIAPPPQLEYFSFGFQMSVADTIWIRAIQDFDYCETSLARHLCEGNGWLTQMLDTITNLAPDYQIVYRSGALALTVLVSDYEGATKIFDKGVKMYPKDFQLLYRAAYHAMIEEKNAPKAAELLIQAAKNGGNPWFYNLAARLYSDAGKKELALGLYKELKESGTEAGVLARMREKLEITE